VGTRVRKISIWERKIHLAQPGGGYFYYVYTDPATGKHAFKVSCVKPVDAGRILPDVPAVFPQERRSQQVVQVREAAAYVRTNGREAALGEFNNPNGTFSKPYMFIFAFDRNGTLLANPYLPGKVGLNRLSDRYPYGEHPVPYILSNAEQGGGFMCYFFSDP